MPQAKSPKFSRDTLAFLTSAGRQKSLTWLDRNRDAYERHLLKPLLHTVARAKSGLGSQAAGYHFPLRGIARMKCSANWKSQGGVYKNWVSYSAARPRVSRFETNPNLYFMIDLNDSDDPFLVAGGLYVPSSRQLRAIREAIATDATTFDRLFASRDFARCFPGGFSHDRKATRAPRGFDPDHPRMDWLKLQAYFVWKPYTLKQLTSVEFPEILTSDWRQILRLNALLDQAIQGRWVKNPYSRPFEDFVEAPQRPMDF